jgi:dihydroorotate dehydrogenase
MWKKKKKKKKKKLAHFYFFLVAMATNLARFGVSLREPGVRAGNVAYVAMPCYAKSGAKGCARFAIKHSPRQTLARPFVNSPFNLTSHPSLHQRIAALATATATATAASFGWTDAKFEAASTAAAILRHLTDPEAGHKLGIRAAAAGLLPSDPRPDPPSLATNLAGLRLANPLGLAAGFDKDAEAMGGLLGLGFGFVECGSICPLPQPGNPAPRVWRLPALGAIINRYGFNSAGGPAAAAKLAAFRAAGPAPRGGLVGVNLGKNKLSPDAASDYADGASRFAALSDFLIINVSSPNTPGLRDLQGRAALTGLVKAAVKARDEATRGWDPAAHGGRCRPPLFVKVAPDVTEPEAADIVAAALSAGADGLVVGNTTISRPLAVAAHAHGAEAGGLSGKPLEALATDRVALFYRLTKGKLPIIGVGGVSDGVGAYAKVRAGASAVEVYTGFAYEGPALVPRLKAELAALLARDGFASVGEAVGVDSAKRKCE